MVDIESRIHCWPATCISTWLGDFSYYESIFRGFETLGVVKYLRTIDRGTEYLAGCTAF